MSFKHKSNSVTFSFTVKYAFVKSEFISLTIALSIFVFFNIQNSIAPPPTNPDRLISDGNGGFIELDDDGIPLGTWHWCPDEEVWLFDEMLPLGDLPQTGLLNWPIVVLLISGILMIAFGIFIVKRSKEEAHNAF